MARATNRVPRCDATSTLRVPTLWADSRKGTASPLGKQDSSSPEFILHPLEHLGGEKIRHVPP